jgi:hypothetical protein
LLNGRPNSGAAITRSVSVRNAMGLSGGTGVLRADVMAGAGPRCCCRQPRSTALALIPTSNG